MCTTLTIMAFLGYMPPKGTVVIVPQSAISQYTAAQQRKAKHCAHSHGIKWKIEGGK